MGSLQRAQWQFLPWDSSLLSTQLFTEKGVHKTRQDKTDLTYSTHMSSIHFLQDYVALWYSRWWIQRLKQRISISTSDFFSGKILHLTTLWQHVFFSRGLNTTKISRPRQDQFWWIWKWNKSNLEIIHSINHQLLHLKSSLLHDRCHCGRGFWMASPAEATEKRARSTWGRRVVGGLEGESLQQGGNDVPSSDFDVIFVGRDLIHWWFSCAAHDVVYDHVEPLVSYDGGPRWCLAPCPPGTGHRICSTGRGDWGWASGTCVAWNRCLHVPGS